MTGRTIANALWLSGLLASRVASQECLAVPRHDRAAAATEAMVREIQRVGLISPHRDSIKVGPELVADSSASLFVEIFWGRTGVSGLQYVALAGPDSLCGVAGRGISFGIRADSASAAEWNAALPRVAPGLDLTDATAARAVALAALVYATSFRWDTVSTSARSAEEGWSVSGVVATEGWRRLFFVHLAKNGAIGDLFLQWPPDAPEHSH